VFQNMRKRFQKLLTFTQISSYHFCNLCNSACKKYAIICDMSNILSFRHPILCFTSHVFYDALLLKKEVVF
jgi:hypothetical protein